MCLHALKTLPGSLWFSVWFCEMGVGFVGFSYALLTVNHGSAADNGEPFGRTVPAGQQKLDGDGVRERERSGLLGKDHSNLDCGALKTIDRYPIYVFVCFRERETERERDGFYWAKVYYSHVLDSFQTSGLHFRSTMLTRSTAFGYILAPPQKEKGRRNFQSWLKQWPVRNSGYAL